MKKNVLKVVFAIALFALGSCNNDDRSEFKTTDFQEEYTYTNTLVTESRQNLRKSILEITELIKGLSNDKLILKEIYLSVQNNVYFENEISLNDLLNYEQSEAYRSAKIPSNIQGHFRDAILGEIKNNPSKYPNLNYFINKNKGKFSKQNEGGFFENADITFYAPYLTNDLDEEIDPYVGTTYAPAVIDSDEGLAYKYNSMTKKFEEVIIDDDYANQNFTLIIQPNIITSMNHGPHLLTPADGETGGGETSGGSGGTYSNSNNSYNGDCTLLEPRTNNGYIRQVFIGHARINNKKQYDKLISFTGNGGGSEIRIGRLDSRKHIEVDSTGNIAANSWDNIVAINFSRKDIRKKRTKWVGSLWHNNWQCKGDIHEVLFGVYEEDTEGDVNFSGGLKWKNQDLVSLSYNIQNRSKDQIIRQFTREKTEFFSTNLLDQGGGKLNGLYSFSDRSWGVYDFGTDFSYTMPHRWVYIGNNDMY